MPTDTPNLVLLCSRHPHVLHQPGWHAKLLPDATFEVTDPEGIVRATSPPRLYRLWSGAEPAPTLEAGLPRRLGDAFDRVSFGDGDQDGFGEDRW